MLKLFPLHQQHRVKKTSLNCFVDAEQHKESEREKIMPGRERGIVVGGRGVVRSEKGRRGRGEE